MMPMTMTMGCVCVCVYGRKCLHWWERRCWSRCCSSAPRTLAYFCTGRRKAEPDWSHRHFKLPLRNDGLFHTRPFIESTLGIIGIASIGWCGFLFVRDALVSIHCLL